ncbi:acetolactate synthase large subunit [Rhodoferax antarcticus]|uniref:Thiamine pyrophosphate-binding protein n=1 Tax=Rhodoferax antarcticus ANT.BR TaxID=1111071 RepID=A0A1Q8YHS7_9BURK|nr:acetolactate synthase large subunit [Rhodoferax antarcticus]APW48134.1 acetolactate synthase large subunit [Rhodoferax antarcticus]OLP07552.1 thiamine pyrophosphate-binding protein [Rhodoferax antarcticus ANT.BR]
MNGAQSLVQTLLRGGMKVCFANPGTSEMHFVAALDAHPDLRCVLCLFEGGATGAADGYFRMTGDIAATLLHLSPGLGNGFANLHTARKAGSAMLTIVGDHATHHMAYESPLKGDISALSRAIAHWTRVSTDANNVASDGAHAMAAARAHNGQLATLVLPANTAWQAAKGSAARVSTPALIRPDLARIRAAAHTLQLSGAALLVDGPTLHGELGPLAARIAKKTGARLIAPYLASRIRRGVGAVAFERLAYGVDENAAVLKDVRHMLLVGAQRPTNFFAYPGKPSLPEAAGTAVHDLCSRSMDVGYTLGVLADCLGVCANDDFDRLPLALPELPSGRVMDLTRIGQALAHLLPGNAIVVDESITMARYLMPPSARARAHDWLHTTGGAIGFGLPNAVGAAIACPNRQVLALTGDGSAMYTLQALWTMAREQLKVITVVFANQGYQILRGELVGVGVTAVGRNAVRMLNVTQPQLDWVKLSEGHGVPAHRVTDVDGFVAAMQVAIAKSGPHLIEVVCPV